MVNLPSPWRSHLASRQVAAESTGHVPHLLWMDSESRLATRVAEQFPNQQLAFSHWIRAGIVPDCDRLKDRSQGGNHAWARFDVRWDDDVVSGRLVGRVGRAVLTVAMAGFFALVGLVMVMAITGFGPGLGLCVPGARSVHGLTPAVGGGAMATSLCASQAAAAAVWPWPIVSVAVGAVVGGIFATGLIHIFRSGIRHLNRRGKRRTKLWYPTP